LGYLIFYLAFLIGCMLGSGWLASKKGRSAILWSIFGLFFGLLAVLVAAALRPVAPAEAR
jgi:hypothetical protein